MFHRLFRVLSVVGAGLTLPSIGSAQIRASERGVAAQTVDGTTITIDYARPQVRQRDSIFGGVVHWGEMWTPGANWATTFTVDKDIRLNGQTVPAGAYSMWFVVQPEEWTIVLDTTARRFHTNRPKPNDAQIRFPVRPEASEAMEILTFSFPAVSATGGTLAFRWATTSIPMSFEVQSSREITFAADRADAYVGSYSWIWASPDPTAQPKPGTFEVFYEDDHLMANLDPAPFDALRRIILIEVADDWFIFGSTVDGKLFDMITDVTLEFTVEDGHASRLELRGPTDAVMATGERTE